MNIFMMILVAIFMVGFYLVSSPSQRVIEQETEYAVNQSDMRTIAQCASAAHNAQIRGVEFQDICTEQNSVTSQYICMNSSMRITDCNVTQNKRPAYSYIITTTMPLDMENYNDMLDILESDFPDAGTFGIFLGGKIMAGGTSTARTVPDAIITELGLGDGQLIYLTQFEIPDADTTFSAAVQADVLCPIGTIKTYRFGRWQCIGYNTKTDCGGDMIWDSELLECVPDNTKKPLCAEQQTAVLVDSVWECVNPFPEKACPSNMIARLNYTTLEWECVADPNMIANVKKCQNTTGGAVFGAIGATLRVPSASSCTDCEVMITDPNTCASACIPDPAKINDPACYPGDASECTGNSHGLYFGFPSATYVANVSGVDASAVPFDTAHSQNRMFNCLECADGEIDPEKSMPPYIAICK